MKYFVTITFFAIAICYNSCRTDNIQFSSSWESLNLPAYFNANDYSVYKIFDDKAVMNCTDLKILNENCETDYIYKFGFSITPNKYFQVLLYQQDFNSDTVHFKLMTFDPKKKKVISSIVLMEYNGDGISIDGTVFENLEIIKTYREYLGTSPEDRERIKVIEYQSKFKISEKTGEIQLLTKSDPQEKFYRMTEKGLIPYDQNSTTR